MHKTGIEGRAASMAEDIKSTAEDLAGDASARVEELASQATATVDHIYGQVRNQVREAATTASRTVERQPLVALMAIGLVCGVVGFLLARR